MKKGLSGVLWARKMVAGMLQRKVDHVAPWTNCPLGTLDASFVGLAIVEDHKGILIADGTVDAI